MKRRSKVSGHRSEARRPNAPKFKSGSASKQAIRTTSSVASEQGENARLTRELNEAREQQTAASEVLRVISSSPGDLQPVFAAMLENAVRICDAKFGNIYRRDGDALQLVATHNTPPAFAEYHRRSPNVTGPATNQMLAAKSVIHVADMAAEQAYTKRDPTTVAAVELGRVRTFVAVPMLPKIFEILNFQHHPI